MQLPRYAIIEKQIGETPLEAAQRWRQENHVSFDTPTAYAGRLDPMASGALLLLIGDECKHQNCYHNLDKEYEFEVLVGVGSDTGDVLGLLKTDDRGVQASAADIQKSCRSMIGDIELPYPAFSAKTVAGKPLHIWTLEGRLDEIEIPTKTSTIYTQELLSLRTETKAAVYRYATQKIETITPVTEASKALGNDFRRTDVRASWQLFLDSPHTPKEFQVANIRCIASSGTYMRTLANEIAKKLGTSGLAYSIHRKTIGSYQSLPFGFGFWKKRY